MDMVVGQLDQYRCDNGSAIGQVTRERHRGNAFAARSALITLSGRSPVSSVWPARL
jgi:hypothetical protein